MNKENLETSINEQKNLKEDILCINEKQILKEDVLSRNDNFVNEDILSRNANVVNENIYSANEENLSNDKYNQPWVKLITDEIIDIKETLFSGQVFNFHKTDTSEYTGSIYFFVISFLQKDDQVFYRILYSEIEDINLINMCIKRFLTLQINYKSELIGLRHKGLRLINNSLLPTIFSFICSANNNVKRISKMVNYLYSKGKHACVYKDKDFYIFPDLHLLENVEEDLKQNGFGYRSRYICETAKMILNNDQFENIRDFDNLIIKNISLDYLDIENMKFNLIKLPGIGPKVRDCISLMGLGLLHIVPIDTHIFKHAIKTFNLEDKKLTNKNYKEIQQKYVEKWGKYAGIYQLFAFKEYLGNVIKNDK